MREKILDDERKLYMQGLMLIYGCIENTKCRCENGTCYISQDDMDYIKYCKDYAYNMLKKFKRI